MPADLVLRLSAAMADMDVDALFVSNPKNVRYLTGFQATMPGDVQPLADPEALLLVTAGETHLLCDGRYIAGVRNLPDVTPVLIESPSGPRVFADAIKKVLGAGKKSIGFEADALLHADAAGLFAALPDYTWRPAQAVFAELRAIKSQAEIGHIRAAQAITSRCFDHIAGWIRPGMSEREVAVEIEAFNRREGEGNSFAPIVAFGLTSCQPHYAPSASRKLEQNQLVLLDFGAISAGYCGDMTRMLVMGKADARMREVYDLVLEAQLRCLKAIRPGETGHSLDAVCRDYFASKGCAEHFLHGTGHGIGLAVHEDPRIKRTVETPVQVGMVFSVEPGLYYEDWGGVRIEDLIAVTADGHENLTTTPKTLLEVG